MNLNDTANDSRDVKQPNRDEEVSIVRPIETSGSLENVDVSIKGYSNSFGGKIVDRSFEPVEKKINENGNLEMTIRTTQGNQGADYIIEYTVETENGVVDVARFFYQNGLFSASEAGNLTYRISAELERFSGTYSDGQDVFETTNFADVNGDLIEVTSPAPTPQPSYVSASSPFTKHNSEPIPYFKGGGSFVFPDELFSSRESTLFLVLQWDQNFDEDFRVARIVQGGNTYLEIRNAQSYVELRSEFTNDLVYDEETYASNILVASLKINPQQATVEGSVNREIDSERQQINGLSFSSGPAKLELNPEGDAQSLKFFDAIAYDEALSDQNINKISKQLSYLYKTNLTSQQKNTVGKGSPKIRNHMFYESRKYDVIVPINGLKSYTVDEIRSQNQNSEWNYATPVSSVAVDPQGKIAVGKPNGDVESLSHTGEQIWKFEGHSYPINSVEKNSEGEIYSAAETVKKIDTWGEEVWNSGVHQATITDFAIFQDLALYSGSENGTVRRIVANDGSEDTSGNWPYSDITSKVTSVVVGKDQRVYVGFENGELRILNQNGSLLTNLTPFDSKVGAVSVRDGAFYVASGGEVKKFDQNLSKMWSVEAFSTQSDIRSLSVHPNGNIFALEATEEKKIVELNDSGEAVSFLPNSQNVGDIGTDLTIEPGTYEPHWRS